MHLELKAIYLPTQALLGPGLNKVWGRYAILGLLFAVLLSGCASSGYEEPARVESRPLNDEPPTPSDEYSEDTSAPLQNREIDLQRAEYYRDIAEQQANSGSAAINASLSAAEYSIQAGDFNGAKTELDLLDPSQLEPVQRDRFDIVSAYVDYSNADYDKALYRLTALIERHPDTLKTVSTQKVDALLLSAFCYQAQGNAEANLNALLQRERLLNGPARAETSRYIWQIIDGLSEDQKLRLLETSSNPAVRNRIQQSSQAQYGSNSFALPGTSNTPAQFDQWRDTQSGAGLTSAASQWDETSPRSVAVILPLTSRFNKAAQALLDGIKYQHEQNLSLAKPLLNVYDIGANPNQVAQYYSAAINSGADFIIGPLGKDYANTLAPYASQSGQTPTILLGGDSYIGGAVTRFTMSPERDGIVVSERAAAAGHITAAVLAPSTPSGQRTSQAFTEQWLSNGGRISKIVEYSPKQFDHSTELKQLFDIGQSEYRYTKLSNTLGFKPVFAAYRRADVDFIFMIADNKTGRIVRPQINFFSGSTIPVFASASVYNGIEDRTNNVDLDQTSFPVAPWVLRSSDVAPYAGQLNLLFAMGADAYQLAGNFRRLKSSPTVAIDGNMGQLNIAANNEIFYRPIWAEFSNGVPVTSAALPPIDPDARRQLGGQRGFGANRSGSSSKSYNDANWNSRESRRKAGE